jgi:hypothetical protein
MFAAVGDRHSAAICALSKSSSLSRQRSEQVDAMDPNKFFAEQRFTRSRVKNWEFIADIIKKAGWSWGCLSAVDCKDRTIWIADAHRGDGRRFIVHADEKLTAFLELESAIKRDPAEMLQTL